MKIEINLEALWMEEDENDLELLIQKAVRDEVVKLVRKEINTDEIIRLAIKDIQAKTRDLVVQQLRDVQAKVIK